MRLLASTDLALRVLMRLSTAPEQRVSTDVLARELVISRNHLHKIVHFLTDAGFLRTVRGARGGVMLAMPADKIRVGDVIRRHEQIRLSWSVSVATAGRARCSPVPSARYAGRRTAGLLPASRSKHAGRLPRQRQLPAHGLAKPKRARKAERHRA